MVSHNLSEKRLARITHVVARRQHGLVVVLEDIHDPHNAEAIFRSCDAFGVQDVCLIFDSHDPWNPQTIGKQSSSSANKWLSFTSSHSTKTCLQELKKKGYTLIGTVLDVNAQNLHSYDFTRHKKIALIVGNEHRGLSQDARSLCDALVHLPMRGMIESFNVSVATALFLFEITRQRGPNKKFNLTEKEQAALVKDFIARSRKR